MSKSKITANSAKRHLLLACLAIICITALAIYFFAFGVVKASYAILMDVEISSKLGINGDSNALHFGNIQPGGWSKKSLILSNNNPYPLQIVLSLRGNISSFIVLPENYFMLLANTNQTIDVWVQTPDDAEYGIYTGKLYVVMKRQFLS